MKLPFWYSRLKVVQPRKFYSEIAICYHNSSWNNSRFIQITIYNIFEGCTDLYRLPSTIFIYILIFAVLTNHNRCGDQQRDVA